MDADSDTTTVVGQTRTPEGVPAASTVLEIAANLSNKEQFSSGCSWIVQYGHDHPKVLAREEILQSLLDRVEPGGELLLPACQALSTLTLDTSLRLTVCQSRQHRKKIVGCFAVGERNPGAAQFLTFAANCLSNQVNKNEICKHSSVFKNLVRLFGSNNDEISIRASACMINIMADKPAAVHKLAGAGIVPLAVRKLTQATDRGHVHRISLILAEIVKHPELEAKVVAAAQSAGALKRLMGAQPVAPAAEDSEVSKAASDGAGGCSEGRVSDEPHRSEAPAAGPADVLLHTVLGAVLDAVQTPLSPTRPKATQDWTENPALDPVVLDSTSGPSEEIVALTDAVAVA